MAQQEAQLSYAAERARLLFGCFRTGDANDPKVYTKAIAAVLARYPEEVITAVTHPVSGLPSTLSWLPSVKEVTLACNEAFEPMRQQQLREQRSKQIEEMRQAGLRENRPTLEQMKAKYGENWGLSVATAKKGPPAPAPTIDQLRFHYQHHGLAFKPKAGADDDDTATQETIQSGTDDPR